MNISEYKKIVQQCAQTPIDYLLHNEGAEHAVVILSNIFMNAHDRIRMASNRLVNKEIVGQKEYREALVTFLNRPNSHLDIMLTYVPSKHETIASSSLFYMLYYHPAYNEGRIIIRDGQGKSFVDKDYHHINFCTGDDSMYRIETDIERWKAEANFNDPSKTGMLVNKFDDVFQTLPEFRLNTYLAH